MLIVINCTPEMYLLMLLQLSNTVLCGYCYTGWFHTLHSHAQVNVYIVHFLKII